MRSNFLPKCLGLKQIVLNIMAHKFLGIKVSAYRSMHMYSITIAKLGENSHSSLPASSRARVGYHGENSESDQCSSV